MAIPLHIVLGRRGWALAAAGMLGAANLASAQYLTPPKRANAVALPPAPQVQSPGLSGEQARLAEVHVKLAWLSEPITCPHALGAQCRGTTLEVTGYVPNDAVRQRALLLARQQSGLQVIDRLKVNGRLLVPMPERRSPEALQEAANELLSRTFGDRAQGFRVMAHADGRLLLAGSIVSVEEKLQVSQCLAHLAGCACVENHLGVAVASHDLRRSTPMNNDGQFVVPVQTVAAPPVRILPPYPTPVAGPAPVVTGTLPPAAAVVPVATTPRQPVASSVPASVPVSPLPKLPLPAQPEPTAATRLPPGTRVSVAVQKPSLPAQPEPTAATRPPGAVQIASSAAHPVPNQGSTAVVSAPRPAAAPVAPMPSQSVAATSPYHPVALVVPSNRDTTSRPSSPATLPTLPTPVASSPNAATANASVASPVNSSVVSASRPAEVAVAASKISVPPRPEDARAAAGGVMGTTPPAASVTKPAVAAPSPIAQASFSQPAKPNSPALPPEPVAVGPVKAVALPASVAKEPARFPLPDTAVASTVSKPVLPLSQPAAVTPSAVVQTSWTQPVKPATSTPISGSNVPATVTPPKPAAPAKLGDAYVSTGKIRWDDDKVPAVSHTGPAPRPAMSASSVHLKQCIERACAGAARDVEIIEVTPRSLVIALKATSPEQQQPLTRTILSLEELDDYRVSLKWK